MTRSVRYHTLVVAVACVAFFLGLGSTHLWDEDEGFFAGTAAEMFAANDWVVPQFNGSLFSHKPPFMYWVMLAAYQLFGVSEFAARFGSALFGVGTAVLTYRLGRRLFCHEVGLYAALITCSCLMLGAVSRAATPDSYLVFFFTLALYLFTIRNSAFGSGDDAVAPSKVKTEAEGIQLTATAFMPTWTVSIAMYAAMGFAFMVKGPIGVVLPMAGIGLYLMLSTPRYTTNEPSSWTSWAWRNLETFGPRNFLRSLWVMRPFTAILVVLLVAGPWFVWIGYRTDGQFLQEFFGVHNFGRFLKPMDNHRGSIFYYVFAILIGYFPWSVIAAPTLTNLVTRIRARDAATNAYVLLSCWTGVIVVFFSLASTKLPSYVLPAYPTIAILTACFLHRWIHDAKSVPSHVPKAILGTLGAVGIIVLVSFATIEQWQIGGKSLVARFDVAPRLMAEFPRLAWLGIIPIATAAVGFYFAQRQRPAACVRVMAVGAFLLTTSVLVTGAERINRLQGLPSLAHSTTQIAPGEVKKIAQYRHSRPTFTFYVNQPVAAMKTENDAEQFLATNDNGYLLTTDKNYFEMKDNLPAGIVVLAEERRFPNQGSIVLLGRSKDSHLPPTRVTKQVQTKSPLKDEY